VWIRDRDREINAPGNALVRARIAECFPAQHIVPGRNLDTRDARMQWSVDQNEYKKKENRKNSASHAGENTTREPRRSTGTRR